MSSKSNSPISLLIPLPQTRFPVTRSRTIVKGKAAAQAHPKPGPASARTKRPKADTSDDEIEEDNSPLHPKRFKLDRPDSKSSVHRRVLPPPPKVVIPIPRVAVVPKSAPRKSQAKTAVHKTPVAVVSVSFNFPRIPLLNYPFRRVLPARLPLQRPQPLPRSFHSPDPKLRASALFVLPKRWPPLMKESCPPTK